MAISQYVCSQLGLGAIRSVFELFTLSLCSIKRDQVPVSKLHQVAYAYM